MPVGEQVHAFVPAWWLTPEVMTTVSPERMLLSPSRRYTIRKAALVRLTTEQRTEPTGRLEREALNGRCRRRFQIFLLADESRTDAQVSAATGARLSTVERHCTRRAVAEVLRFFPVNFSASCREVHWKESKAAGMRDAVAVDQGAPGRTRPVPRKPLSYRTGSAYRTAWHPFANTNLLKLLFRESLDRRIETAEELREAVAALGAREKCGPSEEGLELPKEAPPGGSVMTRGVDH